MIVNNVSQPRYPPQKKWNNAINIIDYHHYRSSRQTRTKTKTWTEEGKSRVVEI